MTLGTTRLELIEDPAADGNHRFAITIPSYKFDKAKTWFQQKMVLTSSASEKSGSR